MTPATIKVAGAQLTDDQLRAVQELRDYAQLYGPDFTTAAFNPSVAKWRDRPEDRERYLRGNVLRGRPWLSLNTIKDAFGGKWNDAREAAGFERNRPGPGKGKRAAHKHAPIRGVDDHVRVRTVVRERVVREPAAPVGADPVATRSLERALAAAEKRAAKAEDQLAKVNARLHEVRERARARDLAMRKQRDRADRNAELVAALRAELRDVGSLLGEQTTAADAGALTAAQANAEATRAMAEAAQLRVELSETREELDRAQELRELADPEELERARAEVREARGRVAAAREAQAAAERTAAVAAAAKRAAENERAAAEHDTRVALREVREVREAVAGHDRKLTPDELRELRGRGPAGAAVFLAAVKDVARANAKGQRQALREALHRAAAAAVRWSERL
jgi:hypothetical protein